MKIYSATEKRLKTDTLYTFLKRVLRIGTPFTDSTTSYTYSDSKHTVIQCKRNKTRSFDDIVLIAQTYFNVSPKGVAKALKKIIDNDTPNNVFIICDTVDKWVFHNGLNKSETLKYCGTYKQSDYKINDKCSGNYSFIDIITLMGLSQEHIKLNG